MLAAYFITDAGVKHSACVHAAECQDNQFSQLLQAFQNNNYNTLVKKLKKKFTWVTV